MEVGKIECTLQAFHSIMPSSKSLLVFRPLVNFVGRTNINKDTLTRFIATSDVIFTLQYTIVYHNGSTK